MLAKISDILDNASPATVYGGEHHDCVDASVNSSITNSNGGTTENTSGDMNSID
jgi:hypothetical protein